MKAACAESCELHRKSESDGRGMAFGSYDVMSIEGASRTTAANSECRVRTVRQRDRRRGLADLMASLSRCLDRRHDISTLRSVFEDTVRRIVPIRSIQLREGSCPWMRRANAEGQVEAIALEVPAADSDRTGLLEGRFDLACSLGEWEFKMVGVEVYLTVVVLG